MTFLIFLFSLALSLPLRVFLKLQRIDLTTGFYTKTDIWVILFSVLLLLTLLAICIAVATKKNAPQTPLPTGKGIAFTSALLTVGGALFTISAGEEILQKIHTIFLQSNWLQANWLQFLFLCSSLLFVIGMVGLTAWYFGPQQTTPRHAFLYLPIIFLVLLLLTRFNSYLTVKSVSDQLLEILLYLCAMLFFVGHGYLLSGNTQKKRFRKVTVSTGYLAGYLAVVLSVSSLVSLLVRGANLYPTLSFWELPFILGLGLYPLFFAIKIDKQ